MAGFKAEGFYNTLKVARTLEPSASSDPLSSKRCRMILSATVVIPSATASDLTFKEQEGGMPEQEVPLLPVPTPLEFILHLRLYPFMSM